VIIAARQQPQRLVLRKAFQEPLKIFASHKRLYTRHLKISFTLKQALARGSLIFTATEKNGGGNCDNKQLEDGGE
jgi:hypothetical protein